MWKPLTAITGALSLLLLSSCGQDQAGPANTAGGGENGLESAPPADPAQPGDPANSTTASDAVPPPDAVSHPNGYLPPAPAEPEPPAANSSGTDAQQPATEDQYIRNGQ